MNTEHPYLVPGTVLYTTRITDSGENVRIERYEVIGPRPTAPWVFVLRQMPEDDTADEVHALVQTNGRKIYDSGGNYYAQTTAPSLDAHIGRAREVVANLGSRLQRSEALLANLSLARTLLETS
jgi:hypothetical protein